MNKNRMHALSLNLFATEFSLLSVPAANLAQVCIHVNMMSLVLFKVQSVIFLKLNVESVYSMGSDTCRTAGQSNLAVNSKQGIFCRSCSDVFLTGRFYR
jgi:hypothetical protein